MTANDRSYFTILIAAIDALPTNDPSHRREVYEHIGKSQKHYLLEGETVDPIANEFETLLLRQTISFVERSLREGLDLSDLAVMPSPLREIEARLAARRDAIYERQRRQAKPSRSIVARSDDQSLHVRNDDHTQLAEVISYKLLPEGTETHSSRSATKDVRSLPWTVERQVAICIALVTLQLQEFAAEDRLALLWSFIQPAVLLFIVSAMYLLSATSYVLNMDVPTFSLIGAGCWIMVRQTIFRVSGYFSHRRWLLNLPDVTPLNQASCIAVVYLCIYSFVLCVFIAIGYALNYISLPSSPLGVAAYVIGLWSIALSVGLYFGTIATFYPFFLRMASIIERGLLAFSSVFFVTEQLPEDFRPYFLWSPIAHGMQLLRHEYFFSYPSSDASPLFFWAFVVLFTISAIAVQRLATPSIQPL